MVPGDRIDELPLDDSGVIFDVSPAGVERRTVTATEYGLPTRRDRALAGGDGAANAGLIVAILGARERGPAHDVVVLNAGAALVVAGRADDLRDGVEMAAATIDSGAARDLLERLRLSAAEAGLMARSIRPAPDRRAACTDIAAELGGRDLRASA